MIYKIRRITEIAIAVIVLMYAVLSMLKWTTYAFILPYIFLASGLIYFVAELADRHPKKPFIKIVLLIVPLILIVITIVNLPDFLFTLF
jgi:ATP/ADP translocase